MKPKQPKPRLRLPATVTFVNGQKHITMQIANTSLEDWVDKQIILNTFHISDKTLRTLRHNKKVPCAQLGGKIYYFLPGILYILEQSVAI